jgi:hypothetical protein
MLALGAPVVSACRYDDESCAMTQFRTSKLCVAAQGGAAYGVARRFNTR